MGNHDRSADFDWLYGRDKKPEPPITPQSNPRPSSSTRRRTNTQPYPVTGDLLASSSDSSRYTSSSAEARPARYSSPSYSSEPVYPASPSPRTQNSLANRRSQSIAAPKKRSGRAKRRQGLRLARTFTLLLIAWLVFLVAVPISTVKNMANAQATPTNSADIPSHEGTTFLLVGTDSREFLSEEDRQRLGTGDAAGDRADTIMMLYRPPSGQSVMVSLPRDSYVDIPGYGLDKLNAAYAYGGPQLLVETVQAATGVRIDGYVEIGFGGFAALIDAVGGVDICLDEPMQDELAHIDLPAGCQVLDGQNALGYVRMRYSDPRGDIGRAERQREVVSKVVDKLASPKTFINPKRYLEVNRAFGRTLSKGEQTTVTDMARAGLGLLAVASGKGVSLVVPIADPAGWDPNTGASVVIWDEASAQELFIAINKGQTDGLEKFKDEP